MELDATTKLRRFCFLGSFDPVYVHLQKQLNVGEKWPKLQELCQALDDVAFVMVIKDLLHNCSLVRRDEAIFAIGAYLATELDIKWKTNVRKAFPALIQTDDDLFLFCKYAMAVQKQLKHKGFSHTMRKAITSWYENKTPEDLKNMWINHFGAHGFTHRSLMKLCHISDGTIGSAEVAASFFKTGKHAAKQCESNCIDLKSAPKTTPVAKSEKVSKNTPIPESQQNGSLEDEKTSIEETKSTTEALPSTSIISSLKKLRTTKNRNEALRIIRTYKLRYNQVPKHFLSYAPIMELLIPSMSYLQLLKSWHDMARYRHFHNPEIMKLCQSILNSKRTLHKDNIHPVVFLMQMHKLGIQSDKSKMSAKKEEALQLPYFQQLYAQSFGENIGTGLRMHITINLQENYKKKFLKNHKNLSFYEAAIALAFGYFKKEFNVDVYHWIEEKMKLEQIPWTKEMDIATAITCCDKIQNTKNVQRLITPVLQALHCKKAYDVFIAITPSAGRSNPNKNSKFLCRFLDNYRTTKNPKAKYVIIDLLKHRRSMQYSDTRNENILEICGLDEHTTNLVTDFVLNRFG